MKSLDQVITIVGGTGFLGRYVVKTLARAGYRIRVIARNPQAALHLKTAGEIGQIALVQGDLAKAEAWESRLADSFAVVNLVGVMFESGNQNFAALHAQGAERLAKAAKAVGAQRFVQISAIGVNQSMKSKYARTKAMGEKAVLAAFPEATILRPSIIFGAEDQFFNKFAGLTRFLPFLPLIGGGQTHYQPVYVGDVAKAVKTVLEREDAKGQTYELGGPQTVTFREMMRYILSVTGRKRCLLPVPYSLAHLVSFTTEWLPRPFLTSDQVRLLQYDNVAGKDAKNFASLGLVPVSFDTVVPDYLRRFSGKKAA